MLALRQEGCNAVEIAQRLGMTTRTVQRWVRHFRQDSQRRKRPSAFDRFAPYVWQRWQTGCRNGLRLWEELVALGYPGSDRSVYRFLKMLRNGFVPVFTEEATPTPPAIETSSPERPPPARLDAFTLTQMKWFLVRDQSRLEEPEVAQLIWLCQAQSTLATLYDLVQRFRRLLQQRQGALLEGWIADCQASGIPELAQYATGLMREYDWVVAGITHPASNGPTEGANTKLKLIKRTMYGRAGFPLLRHRVLHALERTAPLGRTLPASKHLRVSPAPTLPCLASDLPSSPTVFMSQVIQQSTTIARSWATNHDVLLDAQRPLQHYRRGAPQERPGLAFSMRQT